MNSSIAGCKFASYHARRGFTIIELLVVIGIIAILVSIILPMTSAMRQRAPHDMGCTNNLRELFHITMLATDANGGKLPRPPKIGETTWVTSTCPGDWAFLMNTGSNPKDDPQDGAPTGVISLKLGLIYRFLDSPEAAKSIMLCPNDRGEPAHTGGNGSGVYSTSTNQRNFSYSYTYRIRNEATSGPPAADPMYRLSRVKKPGARILMVEEIGPNDAWCTSNGQNDDYPSNRHGRSGPVPAAGAASSDTWATDGRGNHLFFDGHTESLLPADLITGFRVKARDPLDQ